ncbi:indole-3-glycerol phosphate synthase TrpC [Metallumcola ferriviriculae]|uniref:Indole-3-glycerol phosphate synthase n=1 Tax=Metallumcola ferriviriculae TaxID=3039180 RepID=A0AAU0UKS3_9FIRM|nr:indole-3-glycerol phosphate synthase TrpC [Desulfitibacteraceae bacterium MK1]
MSGFLSEIVKIKKEEVTRGCRELPITDLKTIITSRDYQPGAFVHALRSDGFKVIAEVKQASPSRGSFEHRWEKNELINQYQQGGAAAISVITDEKYFQGSYRLLGKVVDRTILPVLHKEFIIDPWQILRGRAAGASAVLLIAALVDDVMLKELYLTAKNLGMDCLLEVHDRNELDRILGLQPEVIGVNNRNLKTLTVNIDTAVSLAAELPQTAVSIAESGIKTFCEAQRLADAGYNGVLMGEALVTNVQPKQLLKKLRQVR